MFQLVNENHLKRAENIILSIEKLSIDELAFEFEKLIDIIRKDIPEKKRISYCRYSIVKKLGMEIYSILEQNRVKVMFFALKL